MLGIVTSIKHASLMLLSRVTIFVCYQLQIILFESSFTAKDMIMVSSYSCDYLFLLTFEPVDVCV